MGIAYLRCRVDGKFQLALLAIVNGETLHQKGSKSGSRTATEGMEDQETLETGTLISLYAAKKRAEYKFRDVTVGRDKKHQVMP